eukprot:421106-Pyramimonas_sp.AAC.1
MHSGAFDSFVPARMHEYKHASDPRKLFPPAFRHDIIMDALAAAVVPPEGLEVLTTAGEGRQCTPRFS